MVSIREVVVLCGYLLMTLAYSLHIKTIILIDVLTLAGLYTLRIIAGAVAIDVTPSVWLLAFSSFLFLSLALLKRCVELWRIDQLNQPATHGRDYRVSETQQLSTMGIASGYISVLVIALYIDSSIAALNYRTPKLLWLVCPALVYWVSRMWIKAARREMHDDPLVYTAKDRTSWGVFLAITCFWLLARFV
jgi:4-hydroxybenzoate polyprenyltransferase